MGKQRVERTRANGTMTEAEYWNKISSVLRNGFRYWKPIANAKANARRLYKGKSKRTKYEYQCNICKKWFKGTQVQVDHIIPVGKLRCYDDLAGVVQRLTSEDGFQVLCKECHRIKTNKERNKK